ncbi:MAG: GLUG motif-containing protein [Acutalibacteraceae bacterium]|nr:GLUG motif-containing protein [Acutalibacteraceae bacterium]
MRSKIQISKKILSVFLSVLVVFSCVPMSVISVSATGVADITVTIDTGAEVTLTDAYQDGYYDIGTADELYAFSYVVNGGNTTVNAELTDDIVVNSGTMSAQTEGARAWIPIGNYENYYTGTFYGNDYTVSGLYFNNNDSDADEAYCIGLFGSVGTNGVIKNTGVINSYFNGCSSVGGVVGYSYNGTVTDCYNASDVNGELDVGGVVGAIAVDEGYSGIIANCYNIGNVTVAYSGAGGVVGNSYNCTITNCYNTGTITCTNGKYHELGSVIGGIAALTCMSTITNCYNTGKLVGDDDNVGSIVGWSQDGNTIANCYNIGKVTGSGTNVGAMVGFSDGKTTVTNCYYLADSEIDEFDGTTYKTIDQFKSGEVAYILQSSVTEDEYGDKPYIWGQLINTDDSPILSDYYTVYETKSCKGNIAYTNIDPEYYGEVITHSSFDDDGFCTDCDNGYKKPVVERGKWNDIYLISNAGELFWFADYVNDVTGDVHAKLTKDININEGFTFNSDGTYTSTIEGATLREWTPIDDLYGDFDGQGHTISGVYCVSENTYVGFFGYTGYYPIKNLILANSYFKGNSTVGAIAGYSQAEISNCGVTDTVTVTGDYHRAGGFVGENVRSIENSYTVADVFAGYSSEHYGATMENCYYIADEDTDGYDGTTALKADTVTSGELAYKLQAGVKGEEIYDEESGDYITAEPKEIWGQEIGVDNYPTLGGAKVYQVANCLSDIGYNNTNKNIDHIWVDGKCSVCKTICEHTWKAGSCLICGENCEHNFESGEVCTICGENCEHSSSDNGFCNVCKGLVAATLNNNGTADDETDDYYEIANAGQLFWFADFVNDGNTDVNAILTNNITIPEGKSWTPIGGYYNHTVSGDTTVAYSGSFDGKGFTISGIYIVDSEEKSMTL